MATLTPEEKKKLDAIFGGPPSTWSNTTESTPSVQPTTSGSTLTPEEKAKLDEIFGKTNQNTSPPPPSSAGYEWGTPQAPGQQPSLEQIFGDPKRPQNVKSPLVKKFLKDPEVLQEDKDNLLMDIGKGGFSEAAAENAIKRTRGSGYAYDNKILGTVSNFLDSDFAKGVTNIGSHAVNEAGKGFANTAAYALKTADRASNLPAALLSDVGVPTDNSLLTSAADYITKGAKDFTDWNKRKTEEATGIEPDSISGFTGDILGSLGGSVPSMVVGGNAAKGLGITREVLKKAPWLKRLGGFLGESALGTEGAMASTQGRSANIDELTSGALFDTALHGLGSVAGKTGNVLYQWGLKPKVAGDNFKKAAEVADKAMDLGLTGPASGIYNKSEKLISKKGTELKNIVQKSKQQFNKNSLVNSVIDKAVALENAGEKDLSDNLYKQVKKFLATQPDNISATRNYDIKKQATDTILPALRNDNLGRTSIAAKKMMWEEIWKNSSDNLNTLSGKVKNLNSDMNVAYIIKEAANEKATPTKPNLMNLFGLDKVLFSPTITTSTGSALKKFKDAAQSGFGKVGLKQGFLNNLFQQKQQAES